MFYEFERILPLLMQPDADQLLKDEIENNQIIQVNSHTARSRFIFEFKKRFDSVPYSFWEGWRNWSEDSKRAGLFYAILKTYKLVFDFHFNVTIRHWNSIDHTLLKSDLMMELNEIAARDEFVSGWSDSTKNRSISQYLTFLRQVGLLTEETNELQTFHPADSELAYYFVSGETWFLEALLLLPYEINAIKEKLS